MKKYDYLIVGAGLYGSVFACEAKKRGRKVLVIDKRDAVGGNCRCETVEGIHVHRYGAHIFHTSDKRIWSYVNELAEFNNFVNTPYAFYKGRLYSLPFNMNTFYALWGVTTPAEAVAKIAEQAAPYKGITPKNLEEKALSLVGPDVYETLVKGYTEKQWGRRATELPPFIISRLPLRFTFDNNYFSDRYQGIPVGGYNVLFDKLLDGIEVKTNADFFADRAGWERTADRIVFTGRIDEYYGCRFGVLEYRSLRFEDEILDIPDFQGNAVINYTDTQPAWTRIIEHKHFERADTSKTVITREYPADWQEGAEPYYTVNDDRNNALYKQYKALGDGGNVLFGGRLGEYRYYDMHQVIASALAAAEREL